ncbi:Uncharacterised protein g4312 [Pycnogonum litorale]
MFKLLILITGFTAVYGQCKVNVVHRMIECANLTNSSSQPGRTISEALTYLRTTCQQVKSSQECFQSIIDDFSNVTLCPNETVIFESLKRNRSGMAMQNQSCSDEKFAQLECLMKLQNINKDCRYMIFGMPSTMPKKPDLKEHCMYLSNMIECAEIRAVNSKQCNVSGISAKDIAMTKKTYDEGCENTSNVLTATNLALTVLILITFYVNFE